MEKIGDLLKGLHITGQTLPNPTPEELEGERLAKLEELRWNIRVASLDNTFANFKMVKGTENAFRAFKALAMGKTDWKMLLCYGGVGNGKTHLLEATAIALHKQGKFARVLTMSEVMNSFKRGMEKDAILSLGDRLREMSKAPYLLLDDVGMGGSGSDWEWGQLEDIIVYRYRENLFTVLTSNLDIKPDPNNPTRAFIPERIVSRFSDSEKASMVLNSAIDFRPQKKALNKGG